jgi:hypothetical protein
MPLRGACCAPGSSNVMSSGHTDLIGQMSAVLRERSIEHECYHDCIHVKLPQEFGILEIKGWPNGDHSIQLLGGDFHTHLEILAHEHGVEPVDAFALLVQKIQASELLLVEERSATGEVRKTIETSLEQYVKYLPHGSTYRIVNQT